MSLEISTAAESFLQSVFKDDEGGVCKTLTKIEFRGQVALQEPKLCESRGATL